MQNSHIWTNHESIYYYIAVSKIVQLSIHMEKSTSELGKSMKNLNDDRK